MALSYKARRRLSLLILLVGLPIYIILSVVIAAWINARFGRPSILVELGVFVGLGVLWVFPLKSVFRGIGQADPDADKGDK
ncbi:MAG: DUF2842 domain-containing protein [Paracoccaceae bacterium]